MVQKVAKNSTSCPKSFLPTQLNKKLPKWTEHHCGVDQDLHVTSTSSCKVSIIFFCQSTALRISENTTRFVHLIFLLITTMWPLL